MKKLYRSAAALALLALVLFYCLRPVSALSAAGVSASDISSCCVIINRTETSVTLSPAERKQLLSLLEAEKVRRVASKTAQDAPLDSTEYMLYFESHGKQFRRVDLRDDGYLFSESGVSYEMQGEEAAAIVMFLREHVGTR